MLIIFRAGEFVMIDEASWFIILIILISGSDIVQVRSRS